MSDDDNYSFPPFTADDSKHARALRSLKDAEKIVDPLEREREIALAKAQLREASDKIGERSRRKLT